MNVNSVFITVDNNASDITVDHNANDFFFFQRVTVLQTRDSLTFALEDGAIFVLMNMQI